MVSIAADFGVRAEHAGLLGVFGGLAVVLLAFSLVLWAISGPHRRMDARRGKDHA